MRDRHLFYSEKRAIRRADNLRRNYGIYTGIVHTKDDQGKDVWYLLYDPDLS